ncbi:MAG: YegS/Rv2252/BmrU family lipid kinase [Actinobacteria bacterium]|uniref:Unannotated protein n=1 Tax=freshwater metagenome TaxID=449393 RepID=A0A6J7JUW9_9ZZZZ|nr:YegS/Rv2252/BmrU family lipid kinase [Actinomycetota bacterium]MSZ02381.1 YegS/Rv2252/BmrU family lipid kinase [Actinomycetota bacterium]
MPKQVLVCINPVAGRGTSKKVLNDLLRYADLASIDFLVIESSKNPSILANLMSKVNLARCSAVIAIGGDGIVNQVLQAIAGKSIALYVIPTGTGNDFARSSQLLTLQPSKIFRTIFEEESDLIDLGKITHGAHQRFFGQILSTGFDALVNERANLNRFVSGKMKYNIATALELPSFKPIHYKIELDGKSREFHAMLFAVANGSSYGGGMQLVPHADRRDGVFDLMILHPVSKVELIKVFPKVFSGRHVNHPAVEFIKAKNVKILAKSVAYADGERISELPINVEIVPKALKTWISK